MYSLGGRLAPPPLENALENSYRIEMHVHKIGPTTLIVWVLGRIEKGSRNEKNIFFVVNKYQSVTHVSICIVQNYNFSFSHKKVIGNFRFFSQTGLFSVLCQTYGLKKNYKKSFKFLIIKSHEISH